MILKKIVKIMEVYLHCSTKLDWKKDTLRMYLYDAAGMVERPKYFLWKITHHPFFLSVPISEWISVEWKKKMVILMEEKWRFTKNYISRLKISCLYFSRFIIIQTDAAACHEKLLGYSIINKHIHQACKQLKPWNDASNTFS